MFGLQGKSAKPTPRASFSKADAKPGNKTNQGMSSRASASSSIPSRTSSVSSDQQPEKLSRGSSPYNAKMSAGLNSNMNRRVQSAATGIRQKSLVGPTVKAYELSRKNSEPQLMNQDKRRTNLKLSKDDSSTLKVNKNTKHVRIDTDNNDASSSSSSLKPSTATAHLFREQRGGSLSQTSQRRPFSFLSDRGRSVSAACVASNDSASNYDNEILSAEMNMASGDNVPRLSWNQDPVHKFKDNKVHSNDPNLQVRNVHPRLSKRTYSVDSPYDYNNYENYENLFQQQQQDFHSQMIEMKISEQPEETLKEENRNSSRRGSSLTSIKGNNPFSKEKLNRTFTADTTNEDDAMGSSPGRQTSSARSSQAQFDRMLLMHSDNILQGVSELMDEIKSSEMSKKGNRHSLSISDSVEIENLVDEMKKDLHNKMKKSSAASPSDKNEAPAEARRSGTVDERFNFNCLDLSGIELSDVTCPQQVMDQSVPNSSRLETPKSAAGASSGNSDHPVSMSEEAEKYRLMNKSKSTKSTDGFESSDSNNQTISQSDPLSAIQQFNSYNGAGDGGASSASTQSDFEIDQEEIERKICSALQLLEEEDKKVRRRRSGSFSQAAVSARSSLSPVPVSGSNPDSRLDSRAEYDRESCKSSPRVESEERNSSYNERHPSREHYPHKDDRCLRAPDEIPFGSRSALSCSCLPDFKSTETLNSARSVKTTIGHESLSFFPPNSADRNKQGQKTQISHPNTDGKWETKDDKTKQIFSFLDEMEKTDQEVLFGLRFETDSLGRPKPVNDSGFGSNESSNMERVRVNNTQANNHASHEKQFRTMDCLIRKGSVELAREILLMERKLDEGRHAVKLLEESLLNQRELNIRNLRHSERDFKKRMKLQKEEFDLAFARNEALINEMASEKRLLQEKLDKLIKNFEEMDEKHKEQTKSMQQKHLDEIRRLRKMQQSAENTLKQKIAGNKAQAQEIREMTVKGLEPEVQRIIQRHQQEMSEMRAWHADEMRETEERCQRKIHMQLEDMREKFAKEKEDVIMRERELANRRLDAELKQKDDEMENIKRRLTNEIFEERERAVSDEIRLKEALQESLKKAQVKAELEIENLKKEYEAKLANLERRHESELKSVKDVNEAEKQNWVMNQAKKLENALSEQEAKLRETLQSEREKDWREKERKMKEEFEKFRKEDEQSSESRFRRMQEKFQTELKEMESTEKEVKNKLTQAKSDLLARDEELFSLKTSLTMKEKQLADLQEMNMKMQEERANLTSVIRREFSDQIQAVEQECRSLKASIVEMQSNSKLQIEQKQLEMERAIGEKDAEIEKIGHRVKQALGRKDETILELQKQLEKCSFQINHLEELLEEQRKEMLQSVKMPSSGMGGSRRK